MSSVDRDAQGFILRVSDSDTSSSFESLDINCDITHKRSDELQGFVFSGVDEVLPVGPTDIRIVRFTLEPPQVPRDNISVRIDSSRSSRMPSCTTLSFWYERRGNNGASPQINASSSSNSE